MDTFSTIRVKTEVAKKFRTFSKSVSKNHSQALSDMISFFIKNGISPHEDCGPNFQRLEKNILKRINTVIGFLKTNEKNYSKPTLGILMALLDNQIPNKQPRLIERKLILEKSAFMSDDLRVKHLKEEIDTLKIRIVESQQALDALDSNDHK